MIQVLNPGFYSTIQDFGRYNYQEFGVPISGVMDKYAAGLANLALGNAIDDPVVEMALLGGKFKFLSPTQICFSGAEMDGQLNSMPLKNNFVYQVAANDTLKFSGVRQGVRLYLAIMGGFKKELYLGSSSYYKGVTPNFKINKNDVLYGSIYNQRALPNSHLKLNVSHFETRSLEVVKGPEFERLNAAEQDKLVSAEFTISKLNNRMAYQLVETLDNTIQPILTSLTLPGTVQLTPSGRLIILMRDSQTTGGYPRVLQLKEKAINSLSQKFNGNKIKFKLTNLG